MITSLTIIDGPGRWDMMLALFEGKLVRFEFAEPEAEWWNECEFEIFCGRFVGLSHSGGSRDEFRFSTTILVKTKDGFKAHMEIDGTINLQTRKGEFEIGEREKLYLNLINDDFIRVPPPGVRYIEPTIRKPSPV